MKTGSWQFNSPHLVKSKVKLTLLREGYGSCTETHHTQHCTRPPSINRGLHQCYREKSIPCNFSYHVLPVPKHGDIEWLRVRCGTFR
ncbi:hypothetical protein PGB90_002995 [Kerria lacca]